VYVSLSDGVINAILSTRCSVSPLALNEQTYPKVVTAVDSTIEESSSVFAVRALATDATLFLTGRELVSYLKKLESKDTLIQNVDFEALKTETPAPAPSAASPAKKTQENAKIEGSVQIAIGVKKEVDFATWYTNVSYIVYMDLLPRTDYA
jgi:prolyl-tRNA synthetase